MKTISSINNVLQMIVIYLFYIANYPVWVIAVIAVLFLGIRALDYEADNQLIERQHELIKIQSDIISEYIPPSQGDID